MKKIKTLTTIFALILSSSSFAFNSFLPSSKMQKNSSSSSRNSNDTSCTNFTGNYIGTCTYSDEETELNITQANCSSILANDELIQVGRITGQSSSDEISQSSSSTYFGWADKSKSTLEYWSLGIMKLGDNQALPIILRTNISLENNNLLITGKFGDEEEFKCEYKKITK